MTPISFKLCLVEFTIEKPSIIGIDLSYQIERNIWLNLRSDYVTFNPDSIRINICCGNAVLDTVVQNINFS